MKRELRLGIAGCGLVVQRGYLPALVGLSGIRLAAVADPVRERCRVAGGVPAYASLSAMLDAQPLDAVLICSPPSQHLDHARACAGAGLPCLVEKPPGLTLDDAQQLAALRPEPMIGFNRRFAGGLPIGSLARERASRITAIFDAPPGDWKPDGAPPDPLIDLGCHYVDIACWLTGSRPVRARAHAVTAARASFEVEMTGGQRLRVECGAAASYRERLEVRTEQGEIRTWRWPPAAHQQARQRLKRAPSPLVASWRDQLRAFAGAVNDAFPGRLASAGDGVLVMAALEAVTTSASSGQQWVTVAEDRWR